ncbi:MAG: AAA family ATPase [Candidatus Aenigmatarchaeota archaeon]
MVIVLGLTGLAACGKSTVAQYLKKYGFVQLVFSDVLKQEARKRGVFKEGMSLEEEKTALSSFGEQWRKETGKNEIIAIKLIENIKEDKLEKVLLDGFRAPAEVELFKKNFESFHLVFVDVDERTRFERRKRDDPDAVFESFAARDKRDIEGKGLGKVIDMADIKLDNNGTVEELHKKIEIILEKIAH